MEINIQNYETVLIDYFDGKLNALEVAEVLLFLEQHPDIKKEFEDMSILPLTEAVPMENSFREKLKKTSHIKSFEDKSFDEIIVAQMEHDCTLEESKVINQMIEGNASLIKLKNTFQLTKLQADLNTIYPDKASLKRREAIIFTLNKKYAAAAGLLLMMALLFLVYRNTGNQSAQNDIADSRKAKEYSKALPVAALNKENTKKNEPEIADKVNSKKPNNINAFNTSKATLAQLKSGAANNAALEKLPAYERKNDELLAAMPLKKIEVPFSEFDSKNIDINGQMKPVEIIASNGTAARQEDFLTIGNWMKKKFIEQGKNNLIENEKPANKEEMVIDPITVASVGAELLEKSTGKKVFLGRSFDKSGSVKSYTFAAGNFKFERIK